MVKQYMKVFKSVTFESKFEMEDRETDFNL